MNEISIICSLAYKMNIPLVPVEPVEQCYICQNEIMNQDDVIRPCACTFPKHKTCIQEWANQNRTGTCEICKERYSYHLKIEERSIILNYVRMACVTLHITIMIWGALILMVGKDGWNYINTHNKWMIYFIVFLITLIFGLVCVYSIFIQLQRRTLSFMNSGMKWPVLISTSIFIIVNLSLTIGMIVRIYAFNRKHITYWRSHNFFVGLITILICTGILSTILCIVISIIFIFKCNYQTYRQYFYQIREIRVLTDIESQCDTEGEDQLINTEEDQLVDTEEDQLVDKIEDKLIDIEE